MEKIAYLGPEATFSHMAAVSLYGRSASLYPADTIEDVFEMVEKDICDLGVVPVENSYEGAVNITLDLFYKYDLRICAENYLRIRHNLLSREEYDRDIKKIYSHPMALAQCRLWLRANMPDISVAEVSSTSLAAAMAAKEPGVAAIGSKDLSRIYGLRVLEENIEDHPDNMTRFVSIGRRHSPPTGRDKTSLLFFLSDRPGALYKALGALAERGINMTKIESRPMRTRSWEYLFFTDIEGHEEDDRIGEALRDMEKECALLKRLGSYPKGG
ncbi:MAG: prephenate dehydratase [Deltaproteobacteria bacterium]|nr:prephenate dehydratase [Deltaproteobacteria bacterium]